MLGISGGLQRHLSANEVELKCCSSVPEQYFPVTLGTPYLKEAELGGHFHTRSLAPDVPSLSWPRCPQPATPLPPRSRCPALLREVFWGPRLRVGLILMEPRGGLGGSG